VIGLSA
jgi:hypothetical protein